MKASSHPRLAQTLEFLEELVAFDTVSTRSNRALIEHIRDRLAQSGVRSAIRLTPDGEKASLLAGIGPVAEGGVVLSGHTDVVDVAGQDWDTPPFELHHKDNLVYGRGSCDMKGFIACVMATVEQFQGAELQRPVQLAFSRDEEIGCLGSPDMLDLIRDSGICPEIAIIGEPTCMRTVCGHKGGMVAQTVFCGVPAHSSLPKEGISAIPCAARFIQHLCGLEAAMAEQADAKTGFEPPHGTINVGMVHGGTALNIFAARCEVDWHYRSMPEEDFDRFASDIDSFLETELVPEMTAGGLPASASNRVIASYPGLMPLSRSPALDLVASLTGDSSTGTLSIGTEAGYFQRGGISSVVIGPGDLAQAHKPNEYVATEQLVECLEFLDRLCERLCE